MRARSTRARTDDLERAGRPTSRRAAPLLRGVTRARDTLVISRARPACSAARPCRASPAASCSTSPGAARRGGREARRPRRCGRPRRTSEAILAMLGPRGSRSARPAESVLDVVEKVLRLLDSPRREPHEAVRDTDARALLGGHLVIAHHPAGLLRPAGLDAPEGSGAAICGVESSWRRRRGCTAASSPPFTTKLTTPRSRSSARGDGMAGMGGEAR